MKLGQEVYSHRGGRERGFRERKIFVAKWNLGVSGWKPSPLPQGDWGRLRGGKDYPIDPGKAQSQSFGGNEI